MCALGAGKRDAQGRSDDGHRKPMGGTNIDHLKLIVLIVINHHVLGLATAQRYFRPASMFQKADLGSTIRG